MGELGIGFMYTALGIGFIVSSFFSKFLKRGFLLLTVVFIALEGVGHLVLSVVPSFYLALLVAMFITFAGGLSNICIDTVMMKVIPKARLGSLFGMMQAISNTALGLSMVAAGFLLEGVSARDLSLLIGVVYICLTGVYAWLFFRLNLVKEKKNLLKMVAG